MSGSPVPRAGWRAHAVFLRPRQWPILTCQLAVAVLAAPAAGPTALAAAEPLRAAAILAAAWLSWVVCLNGGTLAFNSAHDRDTEDIAYLRRPPPPPPGLARAALLLMLAGLLPAAAVSAPFAAVVGACVALSVLYSHPRPRWKGVPGLDLAVNMAGYGGATTLAGWLAAGAVAGAAASAAGGGAAGGAAGGAGPLVDRTGWLLAAAFALQFGSFYPLSQLYQVEADRARGDRTLAAALGPRPALLLAFALAVAALPCFRAAAEAWRPAGAHGPPVLLGLALLGWLAHLRWWLDRLPRLDRAGHERGMYRALALWAAIDAALLLQRAGRGWFW